MMRKQSLQRSCSFCQMCTQCGPPVDASLLPQPSSQQLGAMILNAAANLFWLDAKPETSDIDRVKRHDLADNSHIWKPSALTDILCCVVLELAVASIITMHVRS